MRAPKRLGLAVAPQATGHNAGPLAANNGLADAILLRTHELRGVEVDAERRIARVEPGAQWGDVVAAVAPHGLTALAGSSHDVGVVGYTLGGGISWLARSHGVAAEPRRRDRARHRRRRAPPRRRRARRPSCSGRCAAAAATSVSSPRSSSASSTIPALVAGTLFWPIERADEVLQAWAAWTAELPDSVTSVGRVLRLPPMPELPPFLSGRSFVVVEAAIRRSPPASTSCSRRCARSAPRSTRCTRSPRRSCCSCTWTRRSRPPDTATACCSPSCRRPRCAPSSRRWARMPRPALLSAEIRHLGAGSGPRAPPHPCRARLGDARRHRGLRCRLPAVRRRHRDPRQRRGARRLARPTAHGRRAVECRHRLPELRRARTHGRAALRRRPPATSRGEARRRPHRSHPFEPPDRLSRRGLSLAHAFIGWGLATSSSHDRGRNE